MKRLRIIHKMYMRKSQGKLREIAEYMMIHNLAKTSDSPLVWSLVA